MQQMKREYKCLVAVVAADAAGCAGRLPAGEAEKEVPGGKEVGPHQLRPVLLRPQRLRSA